MSHVCLSAASNEPLARELEVKLKGQGHLVQRIDPAAVKSGELDAALAGGANLLAVRPRGSDAFLVIGVALGLRRQVLVLDPGEPLPPGAEAVTSVEDAARKLGAHAPPSVFVDVGYFRDRGGCREGLDWFASQYPQGGYTHQWTLDEQLRALRNGGGRWIRLGQRKGLVRIWPMNGADLRGVDLRDADLRGFELSGAKLDGADLRDADLRRTNLSGAALTGANLERAHLRDTDLRGADLSGARLVGATLLGARLENAKLEKADLQGADLTAADLPGANLAGARMQGACLSQANARAASLPGCNLDGAILVGADLGGAHLGEASLTRTNLARANLSHAVLDSSQLQSAVLHHAIGLEKLRSE